MNPLRPPRKPRGTPLLQDIHGRAMTLSADDALLAHAHILSEGLALKDGTGGPRYSGSTMLNVDLADPRFDLPPTLEARQTVLDAALRSVLLRTKILRLARTEAERRVAPLVLSTLATHTRLALDGSVLRIDIELEACLEDPRVQFSEADQ